MIDNLTKKNEELYAQIRQVENHAAAKDLLKMARTTENIRNDISREMVECRRTKKTTKRLLELVEDYKEATRNLESNLVFALLLRG